MAQERPVVWSHAATEDLESIADFIARDSPSYARTFVRRTKEVSRSLGEFPERGRIVPEFGNKSIREVFIHSYRLIYKVRELQVIILALIHGQRDLKRAWDAETR